MNDELAPYVLAPPSRHYFVCPRCGGHADLETHVCSTCGLGVVGVAWGRAPLGQFSPELALVSERAGLRVRYA